MKTLPVSEFKAKCIAVLTEVQRTRSSEPLGRVRSPRLLSASHAGPVTAIALSDAPSTATASISITIRSCASPPTMVVRAG